MYNNKKSSSMKLVGTVLKLTLFATLFFSIKDSYADNNLQNNFFLQYTPEVAETIEEVIDTITFNSPAMKNFQSELNKPFKWMVCSVSIV